MRIIDAILREMEQEAKTTRRVLERVPEDKLGWKPHDKSMSLGQLALHVATIPGNVAAIAVRDEVAPPDFGRSPSATSSAEILSALDKSLAGARELLGGLDDEKAFSEWRLVKDGATVMKMPKIAFVRAIGMNHWYHHRGQLSVYLRLLDVPVPSIYGPSADENPFY